MISSSYAVNDPPPVYTEKSAQSKSPEHLLVPRLSSVQEFQDEPVSPPTNSEETITHKLDHTPATMATTQETTENTNSEIEGASEPVTMTTNSELNDPVTTAVSSEDVAMSTNSELTNNPVTSEANNPSSEVDVTITTTPQEDNSMNTVSIEVTTSTSDVVDPGEVELSVTKL